ncbi:O41 family O-antigen flippase [Escherichia coli O41:H45]|uniref:O-antigen flippase n=1 Tax=Escherichia coli TaxID=562 RepID=A0A0A8J6B5_ECOLX|nr:O41 family O-antigen flippase [Escherichia coli]EFN8612442.1 O41 family O-antigen flippase [Escherichia coli O41:H45]EET2948936.1 O41 family O-antigen flippase [Escherichia coli]EET6376628.1 O41 family O-antigen flippase [Escherichia coli]EEW6020289.1 O41 family O-antigen flippase [Escherichia coli]EFL6621681.1 O41 family O-antigen flippase [Escherichia coli]
MHIKLNKNISEVLSFSSIEKIAKNSGWLLMERCTRLTLGLLVSTWIARYLGPDQYGVLSYVIAFIAFFQAILPLGMDGIIVRDISKNEKDSGAILGTIIITRFTLGLILWFAIIILTTIIYSLKSEYTLLSAIIGASLIFQAADTIDLWFQSQSQSKRTVVAKLLAYISVNLLKIGMLIFKCPLYAFAIATLLEFIFSSIGLIIAFTRFRPTVKLAFSSLIIKKFLGESWPFLISSIAIIIYMRIDQMFIKYYLPLNDLGIYSAMLPLATLWSFIPMTLSISVSPFLTKAKMESEEKYQKILCFTFKLFSMLGWLICIPVCVFSDYIVSLLYGPQYQTGAVVLSILIFTNLFIYQGVAQSLWIINERKGKLSLLKTILGAIVCIVANLILIPKYGIIGAAISAVLAQFTSAIMANIVMAPRILILQIQSLLFIPLRKVN